MTPSILVVSILFLLDQFTGVRGAKRQVCKVQPGAIVGRFNG